jgi:hypothetical protein
MENQSAHRKIGGGLKAIGSFGIGIVVMCVLFLIAGLLLHGMVWVSGKALPWLNYAGEIVLAVCLLILLPLTFFIRTRPWAGTGYFYASYVFGTTLFAFSCLVAFQIWSYTGLIFGLLFAGVGVVPVAFLATLFHGEWELFWNVVFGTVLTFGTRAFGLWLTSQPKAFEKIDEVEEAEIVVLKDGGGTGGKTSMWKRTLFIGIGWGLGTAVGLAVIVGGLLWYENRPKPPTPPKPPKPWDVASIKAEYDYVDTEGDKNSLVFYYILENTTDFDYELQNDNRVRMNATLEQQKSLSPFSAGDFEKIDYPIFVPAKKRVRFSIHIGYTYPVKQKENADLEERRAYRRGIEKYVADKMGNLDGFDLLEETNRYEIIFPAGWKQSSSANSKTAK